MLPDYLGGDNARVGELMQRLGKYNYMLLHGTEAGGAYQVYYAPTPSAKVMPVATGGQHALVAVLEKALEIMERAQAREEASNG